MILVGEALQPLEAAGMASGSMSFTLAHRFHCPHSKPWRISVMTLLAETDFLWPSKFRATSGKHARLFGPKIYL